MKEIYELGARRIGVFNVPPIGCLPFQRTAAGGIERNIVVEYNEAVELYNNKLSKELASFNQNYPNSRVVYIDVYNPLLDIILNSKTYGNSNFYFFFIRVKKEIISYELKIYTFFNI